MIVLDTSVLSLFYRRWKPKPPPHPLVAVLQELIDRQAPLLIPGIVTQEVLGGVRSSAQFLDLEWNLEGFPALLADSSDHVRAAEISNQCRQHGVVASVADCLIAALAIKMNAELMTTDKDFDRIAKYCELRLRRFP